MAARFATGDDALAGLVRERQDSTESWRKFDGAVVKAASRRPKERDEAGEAAMRQELSALHESIKGIDVRLATAVPEFAELSSPQPVPLVETQALLADDEALLTYLVWEEDTPVHVRLTDVHRTGHLQYQENHRRGSGYVDNSLPRVIAHLHCSTTTAFSLRISIVDPTRKSHSTKREGQSRV